MPTPVEAKPSVQGLADWLRRHSESDSVTWEQVHQLRAWASAVESLAPMGFHVADPQHQRDLAQAAPAQAEMTDAEILNFAIEHGINHNVIDTEYADACGIARGTRYIANDVRPEQTVALARAILSARKDRGDALLRSALYALGHYGTDPATVTATAIRTYLEGK